DDRADDPALACLWRTGGADGCRVRAGEAGYSAALDRTARRRLLRPLPDAPGGYRGGPGLVAERGPESGGDGAGLFHGDRARRHRPVIGGLSLCRSAANRASACGAIGRCAPESAGIKNVRRRAAEWSE